MGRRAVVVLSWVLMAGLAGCTGGSHPSGSVVTAGSSVGTSIICDRARLDVPPTVLGKTRAEDYASTVSFGEAFYPSDILGVDRSDEQVISVAPGTADVGVLVVRAPGMDSQSSLWTGVVGIDVRTGKSLWGLNLTGVGGPKAEATVSSNGVDRLAVMMKEPSSDADRQTAMVETVDAHTGRVLWAYQSPDRDLTVLGMSGDMIAILAGGYVSGYKVSNLSTPVWRHSSTEYPPDSTAMDTFQGTLMIEQAVATADGYVKIQDGSPANFGADARWNPTYAQADDGSVFRIDMSDGVRSLQRYDAEDGKPLWGKVISDQMESGCASEGCQNFVVSGQTVVSRCQDGSFCGYGLGDGELNWQMGVSSSEDNQEIVMGDAGKYVFVGEEQVDSNSTGDISVVGLQDGQIAKVMKQQSLAFGRCVAYGWDGQTVTAYDASSGNLEVLWANSVGGLDGSTPERAGIEGHVEVIGGLLAIISSNGDVIIAKLG